MNQHEFRSMCFRSQQSDICDEDRDEFDADAFHWYVPDAAYFRVISAGDRPFAKLTGISLPNAAEVSRICAVPTYDKRIMLSALVQHFEQRGYDMMCAVMTPGLLKALEVNYGVVFENYLTPVNLYGVRVPVFGMACDIIRGFRDHTGWR